jgi:UDP-galactopyranose mutase
MDDKHINEIGMLKHSSVVIEYIDNNMDTTAHWIYYPDPKLSYHRILVRHNFCPGSKGYWTETNLSRFNKAGKHEGSYYINDYAYPLNTRGKQEIMKGLLDYTSLKGVYGLGRWGEWQHYNSDVVTLRAMELVDKLI